MLNQLEGKAFTIKLDGRTRTIGFLNDVRISGDRRQLQVTVDLTDEEVAGLLGAAQDKNQAAASPIGLSDAEIEDAIADPGPFVES